MKKIVAGGFLSLIGSVWLLPILLTAVIEPTSEWTTPPGKLLTSIMESGMILFFIIAVVLIISGIILIVHGISQEDKT